MDIPPPYQKGTANMWEDPHIARKLLEVHLNPDINAASRDGESISQTLDWIKRRIAGENLRILDMGCGPGLYTEPLALDGHNVSGVDISSVSIDYARTSAKEKQLDIEYQVLNYLELDAQNTYDLIILIYLDLCALTPEERDVVMGRVLQALKPGGLFIFDFTNETNARARITDGSVESSEGGFWKNTPYTVHNDSKLYPDHQVMAKQHIVEGDGQREIYRFWLHYYTQEQVADLAETTGFEVLEFDNQVLPARDAWSGENVTFCVLKKPEA